jgi:hypothetical protein
MFNYIDEMPIDEPYLHQNSLIMENYNENIKSTNVKPKFKPKLLTRIFKCFRRESNRTLTSETSNYYLKQVFFMKGFHIFLLINHTNEIINFLDDIPMDIPILDQDFSNIEHFNDNIINSSDVKHKSKLNTLTKLFRCFKR